MKILTLFLDWRATRRRRWDVAVMWPALKAASKNVRNARIRFAVYAVESPAWQRLDWDEVWRIIEELE